MISRDHRPQDDPIQKFSAESEAQVEAVYYKKLDEFKLLSISRRHDKEA
jgi:hypothetical protein